MSHNHSSTHHHNTKTSNHKITTKTTLSTQERPLNPASQTTKYQPQPQDQRSNRSHTYASRSVGVARAGARRSTPTRPG